MQSSAGGEGVINASNFFNQGPTFHAFNWKTFAGD